MYVDKYLKHFLPLVWNILFFKTVSIALGYLYNQLIYIINLYNYVIYLFVNCCRLWPFPGMNTGFRILIVEIFPGLYCFSCSSPCGTCSSYSAGSKALATLLIVGSSTQSQISFRVTITARGKNRFPQVMFYQTTRK